MAAEVEKGKQNNSQRIIPQKHKAALKAH